MTKRTRGALNNALQTIPITVLADCYHLQMERIRCQDAWSASLAACVLARTVFTQRPLTIRELQHAMGTKEGKTEFSDEFLVDAENITSVCTGLVIVDQQSGTVRLMHHTLEEYIKTDQGRLQLMQAALLRAADIGYVCLQYLDLDEFDEPCLDLESLRQRLEKYDFSRYVAQRWDDPIRGDELNRVLEVFQSRGKRESMSQIEEYEARGSTGKSLLHIIVVNGLTRIYHCLFSDTFVDSKDLYTQFVSRSNS
jgi:hypothetical protein